MSRGGQILLWVALGAGVLSLPLLWRIGSEKLREVVNRWDDSSHRPVYGTMVKLLGTSRPASDEERAVWDHGRWFRLLDRVERYGGLILGSVAGLMVVGLWALGAFVSPERLPFGAAVGAGLIVLLVAGTIFFIIEPRLWVVLLVSPYLLVRWGWRRWFRRPADQNPTKD